MIFKNFGLISNSLSILEVKTSINSPVIQEFNGKPHPIAELTNLFVKHFNLKFRSHKFSQHKNKHQAFFLSKLEQLIPLQTSFSST